MKRVIAFAVVLALAVPAAAGGSRIATGSLRIAIERAASPHLPSGVPQRCLLVRATTVGGRDWATVGFNVARSSSCNRYGFDGVAVVHRVRGRWHYVTSGSSMIPCGKLGIRLTVQQDLRLPCRLSKPSTPTHAEFNTPARVYCVMEDSMANGYYVYCNADHQQGALMDLSGLLADRVCHGTAAQPCLGGNANASTLAYGKQITIGRFRCSSAAAGVTCTVVKTGKGFLINASSVTAVRP